MALAVRARAASINGVTHPANSTSEIGLRPKCRQQGGTCVGRRELNGLFCTATPSGGGKVAGKPWWG